MFYSNIDQAELAKFSELSAHWWDKQGELKTLHDINPLRMQYINQLAPLSGKKVLDMGCGGGILAESMAKMGAVVTGIDMNKRALDIADLHQQESGTQITYIQDTAEHYAAEHPGEFDIVTCLELLEHVPSPQSIVASAAKLVRPDGHVFFSTLNRNMKSYFYAIVGAEYVAKMLPKNTHDYSKFIQPSELGAWARQHKLKVNDITGLSYHVFSKTYQLGTDVSVNYLMHLIKK